VDLVKLGFALAVLPPGDVVLASGGNDVMRIDLSRSVRHVELGARIKAACEALRASPGDARALSVLGEWYAFRGVNDWAVELLERGRTAGASVPALTLARCYWQRELFAGAAREFRRALAAGEAPPVYLDLCIAATEASTATRPTTVPTGPVVAGERRP
jgi:hypothetical protein